MRRSTSSASNITQPCFAMPRYASLKLDEEHKNPTWEATPLRFEPSLRHFVTHPWPLCGAREDFFIDSVVAVVGVCVGRPAQLKQGAEHRRGHRHDHRRTRIGSPGGWDEEVAITCVAAFETLRQQLCRAFSSVHEAPQEVRQ